MKVAAYKENGLQIFHGCVTTMTEHVIVQVVSGLSQAIDFQENTQKEFKTVNGLKQWMVGKIIAKERVRFKFTVVLRVI